MTPLRKKIEGLDRLRDVLSPKVFYVLLDEVLRIIAEHEQETKGGGEPARTDLPGHHVTAPPVGQAGGDLLPRPIHGCKHIGPDGCCAHPRAVSAECHTYAPCAAKQEQAVNEVEQLARQQEPAELPMWRKELERLHATIGQEPDPLSMADHRRLAALLDLAILADVIASGRGQAVVPKGVAKLLGMRLPAQWMARREHGEVICTHGIWAAHIWGPAGFMRIVDEYGDSLCGAP